MRRQAFSPRPATLADEDDAGCRLQISRLPLLRAMTSMRPKPSLRRKKREFHFQQMNSRAE